MGASMPLATLVQWYEERDARGSVVKPIMLLMTMCTVPPIVYDGRSESSITSATMPCPENAASPCSSTAMTCRLWWSPIRNCLARVLPATTALTASRCDGFAARFMCTVFSPNSTCTARAPSHPRAQALRGVNQGFAPKQHPGRELHGRPLARPERRPQPPHRVSTLPPKVGGAHRRCARRIARIIRRGARRWPTGRAPKGGYPPRKTLNDDRGGGAEIQRGARVGRVPVSTSRGGT